MTPAPDQDAALIAEARAYAASSPWTQEMPAIRTHDLVARLADRLTALVQIADMQADRPAPLDRVAVARVIGECIEVERADCWTDDPHPTLVAVNIIHGADEAADQIIALCEAAR